jgi:hypothetical protein
MIAKSAFYATKIPIEIVSSSFSGIKKNSRNLKNDIAL